MIRKLKLKNFQIHKTKEIEFTDGVNVIIGETNEGKSAIIRALYMLLENQPRSAEKIFHRRGSKKPLEIELEDNKGNIIKRTKRKYSLNGVDFKAFNKEVPLPIKELFPLKPINWHKQLDPHFLILSTPGAAAKALSESTGLEEQEEIVKEIKERLSECKSEIKRLHLNNNEAKERMKSLRPVVKYLLQARSIKGKQKVVEEKQETIEEIHEIINKYSECEKKIRKYNIELHLSEISKTIDLLKELEKTYTHHELLVDIFSQLEETKAVIPVERIDYFIGEINQLINKQIPALSNNESSHCSIQQTLSDLDEFNKTIKKTKKEIIEKEKELNEIKKNMNVCDNCPIF